MNLKKEFIPGPAPFQECENLVASTSEPMADHRFCRSIHLSTGHAMKQGTEPQHGGNQVYLQS